jgi:hypothetical protein
LVLFLSAVIQVPLWIRETRLARYSPRQVAGKESGAGSLQSKTCKLSGHSTWSFATVIDFLIKYDVAFQPKIGQ